jgi:hypothetical protein
MERSRFIKNVYILLVGPTWIQLLDLEAPERLELDYDWLDSERAASHRKPSIGATLKRKKRER